MVLTWQQRIECASAGHTQEEMDDPLVIFKDGGLYCQACRKWVAGSHLQCDAHQHNLNNHWAGVREMMRMQEAKGKGENTGDGKGKDKGDKGNKGHMAGHLQLAGQVQGAGGEVPQGGQTVPHAGAGLGGHPHAGQVPQGGQEPGYWTYDPGQGKGAHAGSGLGAYQVGPHAGQVPQAGHVPLITEISDASTQTTPPSTMDQQTQISGGLLSRLPPVVSNSNHPWHEWQSSNNQNNRWPSSSNHHDNSWPSSSSQQEKSWR